MIGSQATRAVLGGVAVVCCVHDRVKREVTTLAFDVRRTKLHLCTCCGNLFTNPTDHELFCEKCAGPLVHQPAAPLPLPGGPV